MDYVWACMCAGLQPMWNINNKFISIPYGWFIARKQLQLTVILATVHPILQQTFKARSSMYKHVIIECSFLLTHRKHNFSHWVFYIKSSFLSLNIEPREYERISVLQNFNEILLYFIRKKTQSLIRFFFFFTLWNLRGHKY